MKKSILLIFFLLIYPALNAQESETDDDAPTGSIRLSYSVSLTAGRPWNFTLIIDYPNPEDVTVVAPTLNFLTLDRITQSPRLTDDRLQTIVDYRFIPNRTGSFTLESFIAINPMGVFTTEPFIINIRAVEEIQRPQILQLLFNGVPAQMKTGEHVVLFLVSNAPLPELQRLPTGFFTPEVPEGIILSSLQITERERENGICAKFELIPLKGNINISSRELQFENTVFQIPALRITVTERTTENIDELTQNISITTSAADAEAQFFSNITEETGKQRIARLVYFYSILSIVIITVFICLFLILRKNR